MMKIYDFELSGHAHRARLLASLLNLNVELIAVDLANRAHKQPDYLAKNPFGQVPVLEDGNRVVADSNAILVYLATQYDQDRSWYPDTPELMAQIQVWLSKAANELVHGPAAARLVTVFGASLDHGSTLDKASALLSIMEQHLTGRNWLVGENRTIADIALYSYTAHAPEGGVDLSGFPQVCAWLSRVEQLPGFVAMPTTETDAKKAL
ncbi:glutathione S-transferase family protein [Planctobacterium marinum]|uniref:glutathione S-transferase family protein n=1 Tax=Planctobacterium marinum TaxID=1631968 RepID=UPI001E2D29EB|nr:glutathione S-transferase [Planctobacterium marinum]MCC2604218.1 glutathione S-transferase [Planctobacterium marinum]